MLRVWSAVLVTLLLASPARAQFVDLSVPDPGAHRLAQVRSSLNAERREAGIALGIGGILSVIGGAIIAGFVSEDPFWLAFGGGSAGWGAINLALSIGLLDLGDDRARSIEADRDLRGRELAAARERALRQQHDAATLFAVNAGLDVAYVLTGVLLFMLADQVSGTDEPELLRGYSVAQISQGAFLLAFDLVEWIASAQRAERVARVEVPR